MRIILSLSFLFVSCLASASVEKEVKASYYYNEAGCSEITQIINSRFTQFLVQNKLSASDFSFQAVWRRGTNMISASSIYEPIPRMDFHVHIPDTCFIKITSKNTQWGIEKSQSDKISGSDRGNQCDAYADDKDRHAEVILTLPQNGGLFRKYCQVDVITMVKQN